MRIAIFAAALAASTALAAPAFAQDKDPATSFTGLHVEEVAGWDHIQDGSASGASTDGVTYGGAAGYDFQAGRLIVGADGEVTGSSSRDHVNNLLVAGDSFRAKAGRDLYAGARLGIALTPGAMIYAKGGYTNARVDSRYISGAATVDGHQDLDGWRAGAGVELKLSRNIYAKGEYRYSHYGDLNGTSIDVARHQLVGGLGVRF